MNVKSRVLLEVTHQIVHRAGREGHRNAAGFTKEVVTMAGCAANVGRVAVRLDNPRQHIDRGKDLKRPVDRGSANPATVCVRTKLGDELFRREWSGVLQHRVDDGRSWCCQTVAMIAENALDIWPGEGWGFRMMVVCCMRCHDTMILPEMGPCLIWVNLRWSREVMEVFVDDRRL